MTLEQRQGERMRYRGYDESAGVPKPSRHASVVFHPAGVAAANQAPELTFGRGEFMKRWIFGLCAVVALVFALTCSFAVRSVSAKASQPAAAAAPAPEHPEIREAIASLRRAREHLNHAQHDFGGHRADAIRATDEAIRQLQLCLEHDR